MLPRASVFGSGLAIWPFGSRLARGGLIIFTLQEERRP
jgi:hypothetical protein